jgi:uncharacterized protein (DUF697 family)
MAEHDAKSADASKIVRNHMIAAAAANIMPLPFVSAGILGGIQLRMISQLARLYEVELSEQRANSIIGTLVGISATATAAGLLRMLPGIGQALGALGALTVPSASTYALGKVFIKHFESGGTFLTFDIDRAKADYEALAQSTNGHGYAGIKP